MPVIDSSTFQRLCEARERLRSNVEPAPSIKNVAKTAAMSPFHFIRVFSALFGETPHQLRTKARLERAQSLLALKNDPVTEICMELGFSSLGSFSNLFSRHMGESPSVFRSSVREAMTSPEELPATMTPSCLALMPGAPEDPQFSRSARTRPKARLRSSRSTTLRSRTKP